MLHGVEVTRLDGMDHGVELPGRAQRGVRRGRERAFNMTLTFPCYRGAKTLLFLTRSRKTCWSSQQYVYANMTLTTAL